MVPLILPRRLKIIALSTVAIYTVLMVGAGVLVGHFAV